MKKISNKRFILAVITYLIVMSEVFCVSGVLEDNVEAICSKKNAAMLSPRVEISRIDFQGYFGLGYHECQIVAEKIINGKNGAFKSKNSIGQNFFIKTINEWLESKKSLLDLGPAFFGFGSARFNQDQYWYRQGVDFGRRLARQYFSVITGGGPGIMEAVNRGAFGINNVDSIGLCIKLPFEQGDTKYKNIISIFNYFFTRKLMFILNSIGGAALPGGFGTLDEIFEVLAFNWRNPDSARPLVLIGDKYYAGFINFLEKVHALGLMAEPNENMLALRKNAEEAAEYLLFNAVNNSSSSWEADIDALVKELFRASRILSHFQPSVGIVGGIYVKRNDIYWEMAKNLSLAVSEKNISVLFRSDKGISEGIAHAYLNSRHVERGLFINLNEKRTESSISDVSLYFRYNFSLKIALQMYSSLGMVFFPGGIDTLDILFETLCLIQTGKIERIPIVVVGEEFWLDLFKWVDDKMVSEKTIRREDLALITLVKNEKEAEQAILEFAAGHKELSGMTAEHISRENISERKNLLHLIDAQKINVISMPLIVNPGLFAEQAI